MSHRAQNKSGSISKYKSTGQIPNLREFRAFPGESPTSPLVSRTQNIEQAMISRQEANEKYPLSDVTSLFLRKNADEISKACDELSAILKQYEDYQKVLLSSEEFVSAVIDASDCVKDEKTATSYLTFILTLIAREDPTFIDAGILFAVRDLLEPLPRPILTFYNEIPSISVYARNAMICSGILSDVIQHAKKANSLECAHVISSMFKISEPVSTDDLEQLIPEIASLLFDLKNVDALYYIAHAIVDFININLVTALFNENVQVFIKDYLEVPQLTRICVVLVGNMAICDTSEIEILIKDEIIDMLIKIASSDSQAAADAYWALSNCLESAPKLLIPIIPLEFLNGTVERVNKIEINNVKKDAIFFLATLILFSPQSKFHIVVSKEILATVLTMLKLEVPENILVRCIDAIGRILFVGITNEKMRYLVKLIIESDELTSNISALQAHPSNVIRNKVNTLISEIDNKKKELSKIVE